MDSLSPVPFIACTGGFGFLAVIVLLKEPKGQLAEIHPDGTVEMKMID